MMDVIVVCTRFEIPSEGRYNIMYSYIIPIGIEYHIKYTVVTQNSVSSLSTKKKKTIIKD